MTVALDPVRRVGGVVVAAVSQRRVGGGSTFIAGAKRPVAVLIAVEDAVRAVDISGAEIDLHAFDRSYPGLRDEFERRVGASSGSAAP